MVLINFCGVMGGTKKILDSMMDLTSYSRFLYIQKSLEAEIVNKILYSIDNSLFVKLRSKFSNSESDVCDLPTHADNIVGFEYYETFIGNEHYFIKKLILRNTESSYVVIGNKIVTVISSNSILK